MIEQGSGRSEHRKIPLVHDLVCSFQVVRIEDFTWEVVMTKLQAKMSVIQ